MHTNIMELEKNNNKNMPIDSLHFHIIDFIAKEKLEELVRENVC